MRFPLSPGRPSLVLGLLLAAAGCTSHKSAAVVSVPKVDNEGERWTCANLAAYVQTRGVKLFNLGNLGTRGNRDVTEIVFFVDDEAALARKTALPGCDALAEKEAGTGTILFIRYRSAEFAKQQIRPANESGFFWGRFFVGVLDPQPKREQNRKL